MPKPIDVMHKLYGKNHAHKCNECSNYDRYKSYGKSRRKCARYGYSNCMASDWVGRWQACGMFNTALTKDERCVKDWYRPLRPKVDPNKAVDGQMELGV